MSAFRVERTVPLDVDEAWRRITRWPSHTARVPLTSMSVRTPGPTREGTVIVARTGAGPAGFDDPMEIVAWEPPAGGRPGRCRLEKRGRVVRGWAEIGVRAAPGGARVAWLEEVRVAGLPRLFDGVTADAGRLMFGREMDHLLGLPSA
ncbi:SRPBCC family protein [Streptomyces fuscigenes]|uniref:SRPBCC family protein n=1 Tax=Streptomyces fuscigenes TaxID=1528880 RepID=UPI001F2DDB67|nr:SRPBCC family protein [Streptomyces fuscigenes]MCF3964016.1 SRPBCC family protein [Streptomyces fuscigenes]